MCEVRSQLERHLDEAARQFVLANKDFQHSPSPSRKASPDLLVGKAGEVKHAAEAALQRHLAQCPYCRAN